MGMHRRFAEILRSRNLLFLLVLLTGFCLIPSTSSAQISVGIGISIHTPPPALPVYVQPLCPQEGFLWTPGYWGYGDVGYYWVPGVWVAPPRVALLWTPGYWGFGGGLYGWHGGYWGPHVGFYGGINYGFGYGGVGFVGGEWRGGVFAYNTAVVNVNRTFVRNVYEDRTVVNRGFVGHGSFNGEGGVNYHASAEETRFSGENHWQATENQRTHEQTAMGDRNQWASNNHGTPGTAAMDSVNGRRFNQQGRIAQGIHSGELTPHETGNLESREVHLNGEIHNDREANGGRLTPEERQQVNHQQNNLSHSIYDDKHNAATDHYGNNEVGDRRDNQQQRIANGVNSGQLSPSETAHLERQQQNINHHVAADREANGGKLTPQEKQNINRRQNNASKNIHEDKHNEKTAPR
jgi:WXXGXW repeat (2 copies)